MNIKKILSKWLVDNGYDGLFNGNECACLNDDLFPCSCDPSDCEPGYKGVCDCGDHDYHLYATRELAIEAEKNTDPQHEHFWELVLPIKNNVLKQNFKCECGARKKMPIPIFDIEQLEKD